VEVRRCDSRRDVGRCAWKNENASSLKFFLHVFATNITTSTGTTFSAVTDCASAAHTCSSLIDFRSLRTEWMGGTVPAPLHPTGLPKNDVSRRTPRGTKSPSAVGLFLTKRFLTLFKRSHRPTSCLSLLSVPVQRPVCSCIFMNDYCVRWAISRSTT